MTNDRDVESSFDLTAFVAELRRMADALEATGTFQIELEGETVEVPADATFWVEHEREDGLQELEFQVKWGTRIETRDSAETAGQELAEHAETAEDAPVHEAMTEAEAGEVEPTEDPVQPEPIAQDESETTAEAQADDAGADEAVPAKDEEKV